MSSFTGLLNNSILLLALGVIYDTLGVYKLPSRELRNSISGLLIGLVGMAVMLTPWEFLPGIFFDTRWILLSLCGLFFGLVPTLIAVFMTVGLRLFQGGGGMYVGSLVIISSAAIGILWHYLAQQRNWLLSWRNLYLFGLLVQLDVLSCMFLMPENVRYKILAAITIPLLTVFPIATVLIGLILRRQRERRVTELQLEEHQHLLAREKGLLRSLINSIPDLIFVKNKEGEYIDCNKAFAEQFDLTEQEVLGKTDHDLFVAEIAGKYRQEDLQVLNSGEPQNKEVEVSFLGRTRFVSAHKTPFYGLDGTVYGIAGIARDITEQKRAEEERERLRQQLVQTQKIESVGQLAGGIAHDFNNMLAIILGQADLAELKLADRDRVQRAIAEIKNAAKRSSDLTQQLLAFARKQAIEPKNLDLNDSISSLLNMLRRVIGEDIELKFFPGVNLWNVRMDSGQVDQILTNLCVNAKYAIDGHGQIIIEIGNMVLDEAWCAAHAELSPGEYVIISISDNGCGIDEEIRQQIFEPFFTTKKLGGGTGLGLATVYGIVKQNRGLIDVYSEPGQGSTFKIYLPKTEGAVEQEAASSKYLSHGDETILLVEDEQSVLDLAKEMLQELGYKVLTANSPKQALELVKTSSEPIQLLLTDVVMPESNGLQLAKLLLRQYSEMRVLFMSGYTANVIAQHGIIEEDVELLEKPFNLEGLSQKIRKVLG